MNNTNNLTALAFEGAPAIELTEEDLLLLAARYTPPPVVSQDIEDEMPW